MAEFVMTGRDAHGQPIYRENLTESEKIAEIKTSPEWKEFSKKFLQNDATEYLWKMVQIDRLGVDSSVAERIKLLRTILQSAGLVSVRTIKNERGEVLLEGNSYEFELQPVELEPAPKPEVPRSKNGNPLTDSQLQWREFAIWANDPNTSSDMIRQRRLNDRSFAEFYRRSLQREARETPSTQFSLAGQQPSSPSVSTNKSYEALVAFAEEYRRTPVSEVRKRRNPTFNLNAEQYERNFQAALAAGLI